MITYTVEEAATILKADRTTVLDLIDMGEIEAAKFGRQWCIPEPKLADYILKKATAQTAERRARAEEQQDDTRRRNRNQSESATAGTRTARRRVYPKLQPLDPSRQGAPS